MTPGNWAVRTLSLVLTLAAAWVGARGKAVDLVLPAIVVLASSIAQGAAVLSGKVPARLRRPLSAAFCVADATIVVWVAQWTQEWVGMVDLGVLAPSVTLALEYGPAAGAALAATPTVFAAALIASLGSGAPPGEPHMNAALVVRAALFALGPAAAGFALGPARASAAAAARLTLARLRAAQVGEYLSFALFQLRDYAITISSLAEALALSSKDDPKHSERVDRLRKASAELGQKLARVLGDQTALTTARPPTQTAVDLRAIVDQCIDECRAAFAPDGVSARVVVEQAPPPVKSDRRSIELALLAVLQNSFEACAARGGGAVTVMLRREGANAEVEVADDGGGVTETDKATVFEPFHSAKRATFGLGLGLSMSRRFLERIGGGLRMKSKGGYTAVLLVVPIERELPNIVLGDSTWAGRRAG